MKILREKCFNKIDRLKTIGGSAILGAIAGGTIGHYGNKLKNKIDLSRESTKSKIDKEVEDEVEHQKDQARRKLDISKKLKSGKLKDFPDDSGIDGADDDRYWDFYDGPNYELTKKSRKDLANTLSEEAKDHENIAKNKEAIRKGIIGSFKERNEDKATFGAAAVGGISAATIAGVKLAKRIKRVAKRIKK